MKEMFSTLKRKISLIIHYPCWKYFHQEVCSLQKQPFLLTRWCWGRFAFRFLHARHPQQEGARRNGCFCRLPLLLPFGQIHVNFTVPDQLCRPTNVPPFTNIDFIFIWQVLLASQQHVWLAAPLSWGYFISAQYIVSCTLLLNVVKASRSIMSPPTGNCYSENQTAKK